MVSKTQAAEIVESKREKSPGVGVVLLIGVVVALPAVIAWFAIAVILMILAAIFGGVGIARGESEQTVKEN